MSRLGARCGGRRAAALPRGRSAAKVGLKAGMIEQGLAHQRARDVDAQAQGDWPDAADAASAACRSQMRRVVERLETPGTVNFELPPQRFYTIVGVSESRNRRGPFAGPIRVPLAEPLSPPEKSGRVLYGRRDFADLASAAGRSRWQSKPLPACGAPLRCTAVSNTVRLSHLPLHVASRDRRDRRAVRRSRNGGDPGMCSPATVRRRLAKPARSRKPRRGGGKPPRRQRRGLATTSMNGCPLRRPRDDAPAAGATRLSPPTDTPAHSGTGCALERDPADRAELQRSSRRVRHRALLRRAARRDGGRRAPSRARRARPSA